MLVVNQRNKSDCSGMNDNLALGVGSVGAAERLKREVDPATRDKSRGAWKQSRARLTSDHLK